MLEHENMTVPQMEMTVASLLERVAELEDAIAPFARVAGWFEHQHPMHAIIASGNGEVAVADLMAARAVLAAGKWSARLRERAAIRGAPPITWRRHWREFLTQS